MTNRISSLAAVPLGPLLCATAWGKAADPGTGGANGTMQPGSSSPTQKLKPDPETP